MRGRGERGGRLWLGGGGAAGGRITKIPPSFFFILESVLSEVCPIATVLMVLKKESCQLS